MGLFGNEPDSKTLARLARLEAEVEAIKRHLGISNSPSEPTFPPDAARYADAGDKIAAIKAYREATGAGLKEAKDAVDEFCARKGA